jgi:sporulation protein YlmC with PRC-barrel domain
MVPPNVPLTMWRMSLSMRWLSSSSNAAGAPARAKRDAEIDALRAAIVKAGLARAQAENHLLRQRVLDLEKVLVRWESAANMRGVPGKIGRGQRGLLRLIYREPEKATVRACGMRGRGQLSHPQKLPNVPRVGTIAYFGGFRSPLYSLEDNMKNIVAAALLSVTALGGAAYAQTAQPTDRTSPAVTTSKSADKLMLKGQWRASKLMGLDVYNDANEKLGDINELILDKDGKVSAVVIGVGGFLGLGEHDIAVSMDKLKFKEEAVRTTTATTTPAPRESTTGAATTTAPAGTATAPARTTTANADANDWTPDHAVMNATKDQLKAIPQFKYSDYN